MKIGARLLVKHEGLVKEGSVEQIFPEDLDIRLDDNTLIRRKFWEVRRPLNEKKSEE